MNNPDTPRAPNPLVPPHAEPGTTAPERPLPWGLLAGALAAALLALSLVEGRGAERRALALLRAADWIASPDVAEALPLDDAYIYQVYGRNLAQGRGYGFRPGRRDGAATSPAWALAVGAAHVIAPERPFAATRVLGAGLLWIGCLLCGAAIRRATRCAFAGAVTTALAACTPRLHWAMLAGMDPPLAFALLAAGAWAYVGGRRTLGVALLGLSAWARPECLVVLPSLAFAELVAGRPTTRGRLAAAGPALGAAAVTASLYAFGNLLIHGAWLPSAFHAKRTALDVGVRDLVFHLCLFLEQDHTLLAPAALLAALGAPFLVRGREGRLLAAFAALLVLGYPLAKSLAAPSFNDLLFQRGRQAVAVSLGATWLLGLLAAVFARASARHPLPVLAALASPGLLLLWALSPTGDPDAFRDALTARLEEPLLLAAIPTFLGVVLWVTRRWEPRLAAGLLAALLVVNLTRDVATVRNATAALEGEIAATAGQHVRVALWLRDGTPEDTVVAVHDVGAIGYHAERELLDLFGLLDPELLAFRRRPEAEGPAGVDPDLEPAALHGHAVNALALYPDWFPELLADLRGGIEMAGAIRRVPPGPPSFRAEVPPNPTTGGLRMDVYWVRPHPKE